MIITTRIGLIVVGLFLGFGSAGALAEVVAVVSPTNPVSMLSKNQVADMFLGKLTRFADGRLVVPVDQVENSAAREAFYFEFAGKSPARVKAYWSKIIFTGRGRPPPEVADEIEVKKFIAGNPDAIGYIERRHVDDSVKVVLTK